MAISPAGKQDALDGYQHYSRVLDAEGLQEFYEDLDCLDLYNVRHLLEEIDLSEEEQVQVAEADQRLANAFQPQILEEYAEYQPDLPVREWWG